ncbi:hypothetical protein RCL_jg1030.t1 [Rhizophagus clarus]|uniref:Uncharacterized protein n=1 Tax=Rhizophagus clarus TaxID=94130 RepID=A0A8H3MCV3_9GLOM|nr:hypothetical protein RCL_jg1030.t1 [Rhizophagus clarus]
MHHGTMKRLSRNIASRNENDQPLFEFNNQGRQRDLFIYRNLLKEFGRSPSYQVFEKVGSRKSNVIDALSFVFGYRTNSNGRDILHPDSDDIIITQTRGQEERSGRLYAGLALKKELIIIELINYQRTFKLSNQLRGRRKKSISR